MFRGCVFQAKPFFYDLHQYWMVGENYYFLIVIIQLFLFLAFAKFFGLRMILCGLKAQSFFNYEKSVSFLQKTRKIC